MASASDTPTPSAGTPDGSAETAIRELNARLALVSSRGELNAWLTLFTDDMILMPPLPSAIPPLAGKEALASWAGAVFEQFTIDETITTDEVEVIADWGLTRGSYASTVTHRSSGESHLVSGRFLFVVRRQADGSWKYRRGMWNTDLPTAAPSQP